MENEKKVVSNMRENKNKTRHVVISSEAYRRLKLFSAKYDIPMKLVLDWFIFTLLNENGEPDLDDLREALDDILHNEYFLELLKIYKSKHKISD